MALFKTTTKQEVWSGNTIDLDSDHDVYTYGKKKAILNSLTPFAYDYMNKKYNIKPTRNEK